MYQHQFNFLTFATKLLTEMKFVGFVCYCFCCCYRSRCCCCCYCCCYIGTVAAVIDVADAAAASAFGWRCLSIRCKRPHMIAYAPCLCFISVNLLAVRSILFKTKLFIILHSHIFVISFSFVLLIKFSARLMFAFDFECCVWFICLPLWDWILYTGYYIYLTSGIWRTLPFGIWVLARPRCICSQPSITTQYAVRCSLHAARWLWVHFKFHISCFTFHISRIAIDFICSRAEPRVFSI